MVQHIMNTVEKTSTEVTPAESNPRSTWFRQPKSHVAYHGKKFVRLGLKTAAVLRLL